ncbi:hypothetical protein [Mangrovimonas xylaniphaga]|uniref:hypothetical protein n=1 Tax=Mangrovimonas xylaniphaga TaxID=1645915 RepID=UPI0006B44AB1|nr:hypothetical protein [Mangrovimonas xylaniphaga]
MKKSLLLAILTLGFSWILTSCSSDDDNNNSNNDAIIEEVENIAESGDWIITSFIDSGEDETSDFTGYTFTFGSNGTLTATNGTTTHTGIWTITDSSNSTDDDNNSDDDLDFNIFFNVPDTNDFEDLNDDWDIDTYSSTTIKLIDVSGGNGGTDTLTFQKI